MYVGAWHSAHHISEAVDLFTIELECLLSSFKGEEANASILTIREKRVGLHFFWLSESRIHYNASMRHAQLNLDDVTAFLEFGFNLVPSKSDRKLKRLLSHQKEYR
jgi:hypothetical protein